MPVTTEETTTPTELPLSTHHPPFMPKGGGKCMAGLDQTRERHRLGITSDGRTLHCGRSIMDSGEHRRSATRTSKPCLQARCSQQRDDVEDAAIMPILRIKASARRQLPTPSEGGRWLHASAMPPRRGTTPAGAIAAGRQKSGRTFTHIVAHLHTSKVWGSTVLVASHRRHRSTSPSNPHSHDPPTPRTAARNAAQTSTINPGQQPPVTSGKDQAHRGGRHPLQGTSTQRPHPLRLSSNPSRSQI